MVTDWLGAPHIFNTGNSTWTQIGNPGDDFVVTSSFVFGLTPDHQNTNVWAGSGTTWAHTAGAASQIFGGSGSNMLGGLSLSVTKNVSLWRTSSGWESQGGPGSSFATSGNGTSSFPFALVDASPNRSQINESTNTGATNPPWTKIGNATGRVVSGGKNVIATGPVMY